MESHLILQNLILERERLNLLQQLVNERFPTRLDDVSNSNQPE